MRAKRWEFSGHLAICAEYQRSPRRYCLAGYNVNGRYLKAERGKLSTLLARELPNNTDNSDAPRMLCMDAVGTTEPTVEDKR
jgi:hypothetical protein